jgi:hypothetical protein
MQLCLFISDLIYELEITEQAKIAMMNTRFIFHFLCLLIFRIITPLGNPLMPIHCSLLCALNTTYYKLVRFLVI